MVRGRTGPVWGLVISGTRDQLVESDQDVAFLTLRNVPVLGWSLRALEATSEVESVAVVADRTRLAEVETMVRLLGYAKVRKIMAGGATWLKSLQVAIEALAEEEPGMLVVQCAARPLLRPAMIEGLLSALRRSDVAISGRPVADTLKAASRSGKVVKTLSDMNYWEAHTPQAVSFEDLKNAVRQAVKKKVKVEEDISVLWEKSRKSIVLVAEETPNVRIRRYDQLYQVADML